MTALALMLGGLACQTVAVLIRTDTARSKALAFDLRIAFLVLYAVGLFFLVRYSLKNRKWRETGRWE